MALLNILEAVNKTLEQQLENDPTVVVFGEDVGYEGGVFRATAGLQKKFGEDRVLIHQSLNLPLSVPPLGWQLMD